MRRSFTGTEVNPLRKIPDSYHVAQYIAGLLLVIDEVEIGGRSFHRLGFLVRDDRDNFVRPVRREWPQEDGVEYAKDCSVGPDAQRERDHGHGGETGVLQQLAEGEFEIIHGAWSVSVVRRPLLFISSTSSIRESRRPSSWPR